jgi:hypothetical protein
MTNPSAIATIPTNRAVIPFMRQLMGAGSLCIAIRGTLHWMALQVQLRFARKFLARSSSEIASSARPTFRRALARSSSVFATSGGTPQRLLSNRQGSTVQRFRFLRLPLDHAQLGQIHDTQRHVRTVEAQEFLFDSQSSRQQGLRLGILVVHSMEGGPSGC